MSKEYSVIVTENYFQHSSEVEQTKFVNFGWCLVIDERSPHTHCIINANEIHVSR